jgi:hypothetical protein
MIEDNRERQGRSKERMRSTYMIAFGAMIGLVIISIISMFL